MVLVAAVVAVGWLVVPPVASAASAAAESQPCVGVIVDARLLGGDMRTGCAKGDPDSGLDALTRAGFRYAFAPRTPGFVCQLDGAPECSRTGTTTYWSYWSRAKGSTSWVYSSTGAGTHDPGPGSTEAWVWQDGGRREPPDMSLVDICPQLAAEPTQKKRKARTASPSPGSGTTGSSAGSPSPRTPGRSTAASAAPSPPSAPSTAASPPSARPPSASPAATTATQPTSIGPPPSADATSPAPVASSDTGGTAASWTGVVLGGGLVAALGTAALARSRRPRGHG